MAGFVAMSPLADFRSHSRSRCATMAVTPPEGCRRPRSFADLPDDPFVAVPVENPSDPQLGVPGVDRRTERRQQAIQVLVVGPQLRQQAVLVLGGGLGPGGVGDD